MNNLKNSIQEMGRNFSMSFASILLVSLTLIVVGFVAIITFNTSHITKNALESLNLFAYVDKKADATKLAEIEYELKQNENIKDFTFSTKEEELELLSGEMLNEDLIKYYSGKKNPLFDVFVITLNDKKEDVAVVKTQLELIDGIDNVSSGNKEATESFIRSMKFVREVSIVISILLIIVSIFIIINTIKLTINARHKEIEIMRLVGATKMYIRLPFLYEGVIIGLIGGSIGFVLLSATYYFGIHSNSLMVFQGTFLPTMQILPRLLVLLPVGGMIIGGAGSYFATMKFLNK